MIEIPAMQKDLYWDISESVAQLRRDRPDLAAHEAQAPGLCADLVFVLLKDMNDNAMWNVPEFLHAQFGYELAGLKDYLIDAGRDWYADLSRCCAAATAHFDRYCIDTLERYNRDTVIVKVSVEYDYEEVFDQRDAAEHWDFVPERMRHDTAH